MVAVSYHDTITKLQAPAGGAGGPFATREWYELLERHGAKPLVAMVRDGEHALALMLAQSDDGLVALRHPFAFSWVPLALSGEIGDAALEALARDLRSRAHRVVLDQLAEEDALHERLAVAFRRAGWIAKLEQSDENHVLRLAGRNFSDYLSQRPGALRTTLKRKAKKVEVELHTAFDEQAWKAYRAVYSRSWKGVETDIGLLEDFAHGQAAMGRLRLGIALHEGTPVAAQMWTVENGTAYIHKLAHDEEFARISPGTTLSAALFEHVIDIDEVGTIDFGTGADGYKRDWMEETRARYTLTCVDPRQLRGGMFLLRKALAFLARPLRRG